MTRLFLVLLYVLPMQLAPLTVTAQPYQSGYVFPINPGKQNYLSGTMGELRPNHFHGGLDIRTGGQIGWPVYATADGYISRIAISTGGYGHALYLQHDDGFHSVYAHLERFEPILEKYTLNLQYERESYTIQDYPDKNKFRYKKGDLIAFSGNTGSSQGPHLHFEIRDNDQNFINPLLFGYKEVTDQVPPIFRKVAFITLDADARVNGMFGRFEFEVIKVNQVYVPRKPINLYGRVGIQILCHDHLDGSYGRNGMPEAVLLVNQDTIFREVKERMSFNDNREILVHVDHQTYISTKDKFNKLYLAPGNRLPIYTHAFSYYYHNEPYQIKVALRDFHNNVAMFETQVNQRKVITPEIPKVKTFEIHDNLLHLRSQDTLATIFIGSKRLNILAYAQLKADHYFLWDLRNGLPDSIRSGAHTYITNFLRSVPSEQNISFANAHFEWKSNRNNLFDTLYLRFNKTLDTLRKREYFHFQNTDTPIRSNIQITLKPQMVYGEQAAVYSSTANGTRFSFVSNQRDEAGNFNVSMRDFSNFTILTDSIPPAITPIVINRNTIQIKITDNLSGIKSYKATLDGKFLLMRYETKQKMLTAIPKNPNKVFTGEFTLTVEDMSGNKKTIYRKL